MDLGYSSSDSDSEDAGSSKRNHESFDLGEVFAIKAPVQVKRPKFDTIDVHAIISQVKDQVDEASADEEEDVVSESSENPPGLPDGVPEGVQLKEFDVGEFYEENRRLHETGQLDAFKQSRIGKIELHKGSGGIGSLKDVIDFNLKNEEKIVFQNRERIAREHANKKKL